MKELAVGMAIGVAAIMALALGFGIANAHMQGNNAEVYAAGAGTHSMMTGSHSGMPCMGMDPKDMDKNGDGICDYCNMSIDMCEEMQQHMSSSGSHEEMHNAMHGGMGSMMQNTTGVPDHCHMDY